MTKSRAQRKFKGKNLSKKIVEAWDMSDAITNAIYYGVPATGALWATSKLYGAGKKAMGSELAKDTGKLMKKGFGVGKKALVGGAKLGGKALSAAKDFLSRKRGGGKIIPFPKADGKIIPHPKHKKNIIPHPSTKRPQEEQNMDDSIFLQFPNLYSLLEQMRVRKPSELARLRADARKERMARKKGKLKGKAAKRSELRGKVLKADAEEDDIYSRDFRVQDSYSPFKSAIDTLIQESKNKYDKWTAEAHGSAETPQSDEADVQAALDRHPSNPANAKKKRKRTPKAHYGRIKTPRGHVLDIDYPSDSGRY